MSDGDAFQPAKSFNCGLSFVHLIQCYYHCRVVRGNYRPFDPDIHGCDGSDHRGGAITAETFIRKCHVPSVLFTCPLATRWCPLFPLILWSFLKGRWCTKVKITYACSVNGSLVHLCLHAETSSSGGTQADEAGSTCVPVPPWFTAEAGQGQHTPGNPLWRCDYR